MVNPELQLNKANISDTEAPILDIHLSVANRFVSSKIYDKRGGFDFDIENFPFLDGDIPCIASYVYTFRILLGLLESAIMLQTSTFQQGYRYHKLQKRFLNFIEGTMN